jgi:uncharacterized protein
MASAAFALFDDIATLLDDVALLSKAAAKQAGGVVGDDMALNAQQVMGFQTNREWPVVWAVAKGSLVNKAILVPVAMLLAAFAPWMITPLLILGGSYLCYEGCEKILHDEPEEKEDLNAVTDLVAFEKDRIRGAIKTDFVLSAEIIAIVLGTIVSEGLLKQSIVLAAVAVLMTVVVYGAVALIVKVDDLGLLLMKEKSARLKRIGASLVESAPGLMRGLTLVGTAAMFLVGGGILVHGVPFLHHTVENLTELVAIFIRVKMDPAIGVFFAGEIAQSVKWLVNCLVEAGVGVLWGMALVALGIPIGHAKGWLGNK